MVCEGIVPFRHRNRSQLKVRTQTAYPPPPDNTDEEGMLFIIRSSDSARSQISMPVYGPESDQNHYFSYKNRSGSVT